MRLGSCCGGGARVCMRWDGQGACGGGWSESEWVGIGQNKGFSDSLSLAIEGCVSHMLDHCLWLSITLIEYGTTGITSRDCDTPMLWVAWHVESGEGIISMLGMGVSIIKYQNMPFIWILLSQDIHGSSTLCKNIVIREIAILGLRVKQASQSLPLSQP